MHYVQIVMQVLDAQQDLFQDVGTPPLRHLSMRTEEGKTGLLSQHTL